MTMARAVREIQAATSDDAIVVTGAGLPQGMVKQRWVTRRPRTHLTSGGFSTMGFELPAAIGAQLAAPERQVLADLAATAASCRSMQELQTAVLAGTPVCTVILDNSGWISIKGGQETFFGRTAWTDFMTPDGSIYSPAFDGDRRGVRTPRRARRRTRRGRAGGPTSARVRRPVARPRQGGSRPRPRPARTRPAGGTRPARRYHAEAARALGRRRRRGAAPMTVASPPLRPSTCARRSVDAGDALPRASIGTVPILWNNVDLADLRLGTDAADRSSTRSPGPATTAPSWGSGSPRARRCATPSSSGACALAEVYASIPATVDGPDAGRPRGRPRTPAAPVRRWRRGARPRPRRFGRSATERAGRAARAGHAAPDRRRLGMASSTCVQRSPRRRATAGLPCRVPPPRRDVRRDARRGRAAGGSPRSEPSCRSASTSGTTSVGGGDPVRGARAISASA